MAKIGIRSLRELVASFVLILSHVVVNVSAFNFGVGKVKSFDESTKVSSLAYTTEDPFSVNEAQVSLPLKVYLEDTDMYGIVFNSNYLKYAMRALHEILPDSSVIVQMEEIRFLAPAVLGDDLLVLGDMLHPSREKGCSLSRIPSSNTASMSMHNLEADGGCLKGTFNVISQKNGKVFCTAQVLVSTVSQAQALEPPPGILEKSMYGGCTHQLPVVVWPDELDGNSQIQPSTLLSYMERLHTLKLGCKGVTKLFKEGYTVVVSKVKSFGCRYNVAAKDHLVVRTTYHPTKKRSIVAHQSVWKILPAASGNMEDDFFVKKIHRSNTLQMQQQSHNYMNINLTDDSSDTTAAATQYHGITSVGNGEEQLVSWAELELRCLDNKSKQLRIFPDWVQEMFTVCPVM